MVGLLAFVTCWRLVGLPWPGAGGGCAEARVPGIRGRVSEEQSPVLILEAARCSSRKTEKEPAKLGYFNLINDCTPLRVCFNNQDTLQQVDRVFTVNLHMSSEQAASINNVGASGCSQALGGEAAGHTPAPQPPRPVSGGPSQRRRGMWGMNTTFHL